MVDWSMSTKQKKRMLRVWLPLLAIGIILVVVGQVVG